jgi:O-antigen/teichoic acid export membrane protein
LLNLSTIKGQLKRLDKSGIVYTFVNFFIYAIYFLRALAIPKILDSYSYGIFSVFNLYLRFSTIFDFGSISYLQKEVAVNFHNSSDYDYKLERQVIFLNATLVLISTFFFFLFNRDVTGKLELLDYFLWIAVAIFSQMFVISTGILRSLERFQLLSKVLLTNAILSTIIIAFFFLDISNIYLIYLVYLLSMFLPLIIFILKFRLGSIFPLHFLTKAWPIFAYNILFYLYANIDKFTVKSTFSFLEFSTYSLYSTIITSIFMAVSLLWSMFYSRMFRSKSDLAEKLDTVNASIIFLCVCGVTIVFPLFTKIFPGYSANLQFYKIATQYAALVFFLPNTLIKYLNEKATLIFVCCILALHIGLVFLISSFALILDFLPFISWLSYFGIELLGIRSHDKLLFSVRLVISILLVLLCIL